MMQFLPPIAHLEGIDLSIANAALVDWGHRMGPCVRPNGRIWCHGLFEHDRLIAVTIAAGLIRETCAGLDRGEAFELARLCAERPGICRVMLRLWREMIATALARSCGYRWVVSYQDEALHSGNTYRFDGWKQIGRSSSGTDRRSGRKGRSKTIWGWEIDGASSS
jgi:antitoxin VapB